MRKSGISRIALLILSVSLLTGCDILTFSGKSTTRWKNNIVHQTLQWDVNSAEEDVKRDFMAFVRETLLKNRYKDYLLLFQSNYRLEEQERTYLFKIFRSSDEKDAFLIKSEDIVSRTRALADNGFNDRWGQLQRDTPVEKVYELLPELADFNVPQLLYLDHTELHLGDLWLSFDLRGYLIDFGKGNQRTPPQRDEKWVF